MFQFAKKLSTKNLPWKGIARNLEAHAKVERKKPGAFSVGMALVKNHSMTNGDWQNISSVKPVNY